MKSTSPLSRPPHSSLMHSLELADPASHSSYPEVISEGTVSTSDEILSASTSEEVDDWDSDFPDFDVNKLQLLKDLPAVYQLHLPISS